jgi:hypothetical protein
MDYYDYEHDDPESIITYLDLINDFIKANLQEEFNLNAPSQSQNVADLQIDSNSSPFVTDIASERLNINREEVENDDSTEDFSSPP